MKSGGVDSETLAVEMLCQLLDLDRADATSAIAFAVAKRDGSASRVQYCHLGQWGGETLWSPVLFDPRFSLHTNYRLDEQKLD